MAEAITASPVAGSSDSADPPTGVRVSFAEGADRAAALEEATAALGRDGVVVLDDVIDPALVAACKAHIDAHHSEYSVPDKEQVFGTYEGRHTAKIVVDGPLADPAILLPSPVEDIATALLRDSFMIDTFGVLVSLPGAPDQVRHFDTELFPEVKLDHMMPAYAIACSAPLVTMDEVSGRTAFWPGTHRKLGEAQGEASFAPVLNPGSLVLWDFRVWHHGQANRGKQLRPTLFSVLARHWWTELSPPDAIHYERLLMTDQARQALNSRLQYRTRRAKLVEPNQDQSC